MKTAEEQELNMVDGNDIRLTVFERIATFCRFKSRTLFNLVFITCLIGYLVLEFLVFRGPGVIKSGTYFFIKLSIWFGAGSCIGLVLFRSMCMPAGFEKPARQWDAFESFKHARTLKSRRYTMLANSFALVELFLHLSIYWVIASAAFCILLVFLRKGF